MYYAFRIKERIHLDIDFNNQGVVRKYGTPGESYRVGS